LDPNDHQILVDFYNSLNRSTLQWSIEEDLCRQTGITCDESNPQRVIKLFFFFFFFFSLWFDFLKKKLWIGNRNLSVRKIEGTIPTEFGNLTRLQAL